VCAAVCAQPLRGRWSLIFDSMVVQVVQSVIGKRTGWKFACGHEPFGDHLLYKLPVLRKETRHDLCDALLRMEHTFRNLSRVKIGYAYKLEALAPSTKAEAVGT